jgi:putative salt-induced outer membrane protein
LEYERDVLAGLDHRGTSSLGLGWRVVRDSDVAISLEAGPAFRHDWTRAGVERSNFAARGALTSSWQMNDKVKLSHNMELVAEDNSNTIRAVTGLQAKLTGRISSQISYDLRYQDRPLFGKEETDTVTRIGLTYDF